MAFLSNITKLTFNLENNQIKNINLRRHKSFNCKKWCIGNPDKKTYQFDIIIKDDCGVVSIKYNDLTKHLNRTFVKYNKTYMPMPKVLYNMIASFNKDNKMSYVNYNRNRDGYLYYFIISIIYNDYINVVYEEDYSRPALAYTMDKLNICEPDSDICSICYDTDNSAPRYTLPNCSHTFHVECLKPWLNKMNTCPECRSIIKIGMNRHDAAKVIIRYFKKWIHNKKQLTTFTENCDLFVF